MPAGVIKQVMFRHIREVQGWASLSFRQCLSMSVLVLWFSQCFCLLFDDTPEPQVERWRFTYIMEPRGHLLFWTFATISPVAKNKLLRWGVRITFIRLGQYLNRAPEGGLGVWEGGKGKQPLTQDFVQEFFFCEHSPSFCCVSLECSGHGFL